MRIEVNKICVPTDFSDAADHAMVYGATLADRFGAQLHLLHVVDDMGAVMVEGGAWLGAWEDVRRSMKEAALGKLADRPQVPWRNTLQVVRAVRSGVPYQEIRSYADSEGIDLLILGTHGRTGIRHFLLGSVAERVVRVAPCPVLTVRHPEHEFVVPE